MKTMLNKGHCAARRGSVMIAALVMSLMLASVVMYAMSDSMTTNTVNEGERNYSSALAAAEYGAEVAIAEVARGLKFEADEYGLVNDYSPVIGDWVLGTHNGAGTLYQSPNGGGMAKDQRRIAGVFDDQEFRVRVRSARLAYDNNYVGDTTNHVLPEGWVGYPGDEEFKYGSDPAYEFSDVYEVTSTARNRNVGQAGSGGRLDATPVVQALVNLKYVSKAKEFSGSGGGPFKTPYPWNVAMTGGMTSVIDMTAPIEAGQPQEVKEVYNITISGEDHNVIKQHVEKVQTEAITTPLKLMTNKTNFFGAYGGYWGNGQLTLNYREEKDDSKDANPYRPKTPSFGSTGDNIKMWVADKDKKYDSYLLGGKQSKTINVLSDITHDGIVGQVKETSSGQADAGGAFNIVLGNFEDLRNLYINMAGVVGSYTDSTNWWQIYVGQYTHSRRGANGTVTRSLPNYQGSKIRAQTIHLMKNKDEQFLVRLYKDSSGKLYKYPVSGGQWTGEYAWATAVFNNSGLTLQNNVTATTTTPGEKAGQYAVGRSFFWQELVGYQLLRRGEARPASKYIPSSVSVTTDLNEPAVIDQRDLPVSGQKIDKRTIYRLDDNMDRIKAGFDEIYQGYDQHEYSSSLHKHPLADTKYAGQVSPGYLQDRFDSIFIRMDDGEVKEFADMNAFLFPKNFALDSEPENIRNALALFIGYEDQRETTADYNYTDMMFTIWISPQEEEIVVDRLSLASSSLQWWERDERDGLSGETSRVAIGVNLSVPPSSVPSGKTLEQVHYELFETTDEGTGTGEGSLGYNIWTMKDNNQAITDFPRAVFEYENGKFNTGRINKSDKVIDKFIKQGITTFFVSDGDLNDYLRFLLKDASDEAIDTQLKVWYNQDTNEWDYDAVLLSMQNEVSTNAGLTLRRIDDRWEMDDRNRASLDDGDASQALAINETPVVPRELAGAMFGYFKQQVPVINTDGFEPEMGATVNMLTLGFLPGEADLRTVPSADLVNYGIPNSRPGLPVSTKLRPFIEPDDDGNIRWDTVKAYFDVDPKKAVLMCYEDFNKNDPVTAAYLLEEYGYKEKRYSIGYHRAGTDKSLRASKSQDHHEDVILGQTGFNPYRQTVSGKDYIADELDYRHSHDQSEKIRAVRLNYPSEGGTAPDFVFENAIDGAGTMLINGNLVVKDTFAYYGALVVLGDVTIIPTKKTEYVYNSDGRPLDKYGHALYLEEKVNSSDPDKWYYIWEYSDSEGNVKEGGNPVTDKTYVQLNEADKGERKDSLGNTIPVVPFVQDVWRGELAVQGSLVVNGKVSTEKVEEVVAGNTVAHYGRLSVLWSREAMETAGKRCLEGTEAASKITWIHSDDVNVDSIWNDTLDKRIETPEE